MNKRQGLAFVTTMVVITVIVAGFTHQRDSRLRQVQQASATIFVHGGNSSRAAEMHMARALLRSGYAHSKIEATVNAKGRVHLKAMSYGRHKIQKPVILVEFVDNDNEHFHQSARWLRNVITASQSVASIKAVNLVGHSMGNMAIEYYLMDYGLSPTSPQVVKQISIGGHYNGVLGIDDQLHQMKIKPNGYPRPMTKRYRDLLKVRPVYETSPIKVLNIWGDLNDGSDSDGVVSNASSQSLAYLVQPMSQYQGLEIKGAAGQHSALHENAQVDQQLVAFLEK